MNRLLVVILLVAAMTGCDAEDALKSPKYLEEYVRLVLPSQDGFSCGDRAYLFYQVMRRQEIKDGGHYLPEIRWQECKRDVRGHAYVEWTETKSGRTGTAFRMESC